MVMETMELVRWRRGHRDRIGQKSVDFGITSGGGQNSKPNGGHGADGAG